jgi:hypothetical protein
MSDDWLTTAAADLGVDPGVVDVTAVLELARDVAHNVERKAAPLTTYLVGYAAALSAAAGDAPDAAALSNRVGALARDWSQP